MTEFISKILLVLMCFFTGVAGGIMGMILMISVDDDYWNFINRQRKKMRKK